MATLIQTFDPDHADMIHDVKMDFNCTRLATCSSDNSVKIFDVRNESHKLVADLRGHENAVMQVAWSHPKQGNILASCGFDRKVILWQQRGSKWEMLYVSNEHGSSVNALCWAPYELGLLLACACWDGTVSIISSHGDGAFTTNSVAKAHTTGCTAISWEPAFKLSLPKSKESEEMSSTIVSDDETPKVDELRHECEVLQKRFVTGGYDGTLKIWKHDETEDKWVEEEKLEGHTDWIRDVAWAPSFLVQRNMIASGSQDMSVIIWTSDDKKKWNSMVLNIFDDIVWTVSWSDIGNALAISVGEDKVSVWKQDDEKKWVCACDVWNKQPAVTNDN